MTISFMAIPILKFLITACCLISFSLSHRHFLFAFPGIPLTPGSCFPVKSARKFHFLKPALTYNLTLTEDSPSWLIMTDFPHISRLVRSHYLAIQAAPLLTFFSHSYSSPKVGLSANSTFPRSSTCICQLLPITSLYTSTFSLSRPSSTFWPGSYF